MMADRIQVGQVISNYRRQRRRRDGKERHHRDFGARTRIWKRSPPSAAPSVST
jgi:hypothetical protein